MIKQLVRLALLWKALKEASDGRIRTIGAERLSRFRTLRNAPGVLASLKERLRAEEDFQVQVALVRAILKLGGLEAADRELLDLLAEKWRRYFEEVRLRPEETEDWPEEEQRRALVALYLWYYEATRPLVRRLRREQAQRENPTPVPLDRIRPGTKVLYRERAVLPVFDRSLFEENRPRLEETRRQIQAGELHPHRRSPAGFVQVRADDDEWLDLNNLSRRIFFGVVRTVRRGRVFVGDPRWSEGLDPADLLEVLPDEW
jgi:hypothetical protein